MSVSAHGGHNWSAQGPVAGTVNQPGVFDPVLGRPTIDGIAGARSDLAPAPSVDIANGAPDGSGATNRIVMSYVSGDIAAPHVYFTESSDGGDTWSTPRTIETGGDRRYYPAPAASPPRTPRRRPAGGGRGEGAPRAGRARPPRGPAPRPGRPPAPRPPPRPRPPEKKRDGGGGGLAGPPRR